MKFTLTAGALILAGCAPVATCLNEHGHTPDGHHPACEAPGGHDHANGPPAPPPPPPEPKLDPGHPNNGFGSGNQDAPGKSEFRNNAENAGGNN